MDYIEPIDHNKLQATKDGWAEVLASVEKLPCDDDEQANWWAAILVRVHDELKALEAERDALVRPLNEGVKKTNATFKEATGPLEAVKQLAGEKLNKRILEAESGAEFNRRLAARTAATDPAAAQAALAAIPETAKLAGLSETWGWEPEAIDLEALDPAFVTKVPNHKALKDLAAAFKDKAVPPNVNGVRWKRTVKVAPTGHKKLDK